MFSVETQEPYSSARWHYAVIGPGVSAKRSILQPGEHLVGVCRQPNTSLARRDVAQNGHFGYVFGNFYISLAVIAYEYPDCID
jgi:hypothetical protein